MAAEIGQQALVSGGRNRSDSSEQSRVRQDREKREADERGCFESAGGKLRFARRDDFVEVSDPMLELGAHATDKKVAEGREPSKQDHRTVFDLAVSLGQRSEGDVTLVHGRRSAVVYSGSLSP